MKALENLYLFIDEGEYYNYGLIKRQIEACILVDLQSAVFKPSMRLYHIDCVSHSDHFLFETEVELKKFLNWLETPSEKPTKSLKILNFKKDA